MPKVEEKWPKTIVLKEVKAVITMLGIDYIPSLQTIGKYTKCANAVRHYGGVKWLSSQLQMPTAKNRRHVDGWTLEKVLAEIRRVMDIMGVHDRMLTQKELRAHSKVYAVMQKFGTSGEIADLLGVRYDRKREKGLGGAHLLEPVDGICSMEDIKASRAFEIQSKAGRPYGEIQKEETLQMAGTIDVTQYAGMKPYAERVQHGN